MRGCWNCWPPALLAAVSLSVCAFAAETPKTILYGAAYYHEYMPYDRLDKDVELMKAAGFTCVRMGESTWSSWEPRDGEFHFEWMDRIVAAMHKAGIKVIMGTPTYSIPPWMFKKHPEILVLHYGATGPQWDPWSPAYPGPMRPGYYGPRQNMDLTNPDYRRYCERIIRKLAEHYANNPRGDRLAGGQRDRAQRDRAAERAAGLRRAAQGEVRHAHRS